MQEKLENTSFSINSHFLNHQFTNTKSLENFSEIVGGMKTNATSNSFWPHFVVQYINSSENQQFFMQYHAAYCAKGQLISKCLFGVINFFQKTNENKSTRGFIVVK